MAAPQTQQDNTPTGYAYGIGVYLFWGLVPLFFKLLDHVGAVEIVAHRIVWSVAFLIGLLLLVGKLHQLRAAFRNPRLLATLTISAALIAINWLVYIWAVTNGHILAASLGYYLNPFVNIALGTIILGERLRALTVVAIVLAAIGVSILAVAALDTLWISLTLALSFGLYSYVRKITDVGAIEGLAVETILLAPFFAGYLVWLGMAGGLGFGTDRGTDALLICSAIVTSVPLMLFAAAARRLRLTTLGFIQYIAPTIVFLIGAFVYDEPLTTGKVICFLFIWAAILLFTTDSVKEARARRRVIPA